MTAGRRRMGSGSHSGDVARAGSWGGLATAPRCCAQAWCIPYGHVPRACSSRRPQRETTCLRLGAAAAAPAPKCWGLRHTDYAYKAWRLWRCGHEPARAPNRGPPCGQPALPQQDVDQQSGKMAGEGPRPPLRLAEPRLEEPDGPVGERGARGGAGPLAHGHRLVEPHRRAALEARPQHRLGLRRPPGGPVPLVLSGFAPTGLLGCRCTAGRLRNRRGWGPGWSACAAAPRR